MNNLFVWSLQGLLLLFLNKRDDFGNKNDNFYNPSIKTILVTITGMPHQLFAAGLQAREIYPEMKKCFYKENSDVTWEDFFGLIHVRALITHSMEVAGWWKKVVYYFRSRKHLKPVVILHATCLDLKMH